MVIANPPLAEPVIDPGGVTIKPPFEMGVANLRILYNIFANILRMEYMVLLIAEEKAHLFIMEEIDEDNFL